MRPAVFDATAASSPSIRPLTEITLSDVPFWRIKRNQNVSAATIKTRRISTIRTTGLFLVEFSDVLMFCLFSACVRLRYSLARHFLLPAVNRRQPCSDPSVHAIHCPLPWLMQSVVPEQETRLTVPHRTYAVHSNIAAR